MEWGFYGTSNENTEGWHKKERNGQIIFILNQMRIENPAKSRWLFSQKRYIADLDRALNIPQILNIFGLHQGVIIVYQLGSLNYDNSLVTQNSEWHEQS